MADSESATAPRGTHRAGCRTLNLRENECKKFGTPGKVESESQANENEK